MNLTHYRLHEKLNPDAPAAVPLLLRVNSMQQIARFDQIATNAGEYQFRFVHASEAALLNLWPPAGPPMEFPDTIRMLVVSAQPFDLPYALTHAAGHRVRMLDWPLPTLDAGQAPAPWQVARLSEFAQAVAKMTDWSEEPPWALLALPTVPQWVIAAYLCTLAGAPLNEAWRNGFEEGVAAVRRRSKDAPELRWADLSTPDATKKLRAFLLAAGALEAPVATGAIGDGGSVD